MKMIYNDGGRADAGFKGVTGDCVARAIAIAADLPYTIVYDMVNDYGKRERKSKRRGDKSSARTGVYKATTKRILRDLGWHWTPTMFVGQGCKVHMLASELPSGVLIVKLSRHVACVIDGVLHDTHDCTRFGTRCVYGYWTKG